MYGLKAFPNGQYYYVGQTRRAPADRLKNHLKELFRDIDNGRKLSPARAWLKELWDIGITPIIEIIDPEGIWDISEAVWIDRLTQEGHPLTNVLSRVPAPKSNKLA